MSSVERGAIFRVQGIDVRLREEQMAKIEQFEIGLQNLLRHLIVEWLPGVMAFFEQPADRNTNLIRIGLGQSWRRGRGDKKRNGGNRQKKAEA